MWCLRLEKWRPRVRILPDPQCPGLHRPLAMRLLVLSALVQMQTCLLNFPDVSSAHYVLQDACKMQAGHTRDAHDGMCACETLLSFCFSVLLCICVQTFFYWKQKYIHNSEWWIWIYKQYVLVSLAKPIVFPFICLQSYFHLALALALCFFFHESQEIDPHQRPTIDNLIAHVETCIIHWNSLRMSAER